MRYATHNNSHLPAEKLKECRWSVSDDEEGHNLILSMARSRDEKRAPFTRGATYLGMYYMAVADGDTALARKIEARLVEHGIFPNEKVYVGQNTLLRHTG